MNLQKQITPALVRIEAHGNRYGCGTGFVAAPGLVLTCAHVVEGAQRLVVTAEDGRLLTIAGNPALCEKWDLALLRLNDPPSEPLLLGAAIDVQDAVWTAGFVQRDEGPRLHPTVGVAQGEAVNFLENGEKRPLISFAQAHVLPGMSGAPLVNQMSKLVCGVVNRTVDRNHPYGGFAVPLRYVLAAFSELEREVVPPQWLVEDIALPDEIEENEKIKQIKLLPLGPPGFGK